MLDHLVLATPDLDATSRRYRDIGFPVVDGGPHVGVGTRNRLIGLGPGRYLELVGPDPDQPAPGQARPFRIDALSAERLVTWAVRVRDLDAALAAVRATGHDPGAPRAMSRRRPDGDLLEWRLAFPPDDLGGVAPFHIAWGDTRHPSATLPCDDPLELLVLSTPHPERVQDVLRATGSLETGLVVVRPADAPSLQAVLEGGTILN